MISIVEIDYKVNLPYLGSPWIPPMLDPDLLRTFNSPPGNTK